jgi:hypothetical protein
VELADLAAHVKRLGSAHQTRRAALRRLGVGSGAAGLLTAAGARSGRFPDLEGLHTDRRGRPRRSRHPSCVHSGRLRRHATVCLRAGGERTGPVPRGDGALGDQRAVPARAGCPLSPRSILAPVVCASRTGIPMPASWTISSAATSRSASWLPTATCRPSPSVPAISPSSRRTGVTTSPVSAMCRCRSSFFSSPRIPGWRPSPVPNSRQRPSAGAGGQLRQRSRPVCGPAQARQRRHRPSGGGGWRVSSRRWWHRRDHIIREQNPPGQAGTLARQWQPFVLTGRAPWV